MPQATPRAAKDPFAKQQTAHGGPGTASSEDGTAQLLRAGLWIFAVGVLAALLTKTVFGGIGEHGPHTNYGWLALIAALMCLPFGLMLTALGSAKWLRNRRMASSEIAERNR